MVASSQAEMKTLTSAQLDTSVQPRRQLDDVRLGSSSSQRAIYGFSLKLR